MLKNWFLLASVSCGVGFGSTFLISRNLQQSTWAGLGTVPAVAASLKILSRQRKEEIERQITQSRLSLDNTQQQERLAKEEIERQVTKSRLSLEEIERQVAKSRSSLDDARQQEQLVKNSCREISAHGQKLQTGFTQLRQEVNRYRVRQAELEREINSLVLHKQTQESLLVQLDVKVLDKQNQLETTNTELDRTNLEFQRIREEIRQYSATKQQLEAQIADLQNRSQSLQTKLADKEVDLREIEYQISQMKERRDRDSTAVADLDRSLGQKQSLLQDIALDRQQQQSLKKEVSDLLLQKQKQAVLLDELKGNINTTQNLQSELAAQVSSAQEHLDRIDLEILNRRQVKEDINYQISELEQSIFLVSGHTIDEEINISVTNLYQQWQKVNQQILRLQEEIFQLEQKKERLQDEKWDCNSIFENNPHLQILEHIDRHGVITESEVNHLLGNSRASRQFATRLRDYSPYLPFSVRVEASTSGSRYVKAIITIAKSQNSSDVLQQNVVELELPHRETARYISELEEQAIQHLTFDLESQSNDDSIERIIPTYNTCRSCERTPMYGHDYCSKCS